MKISSVIFGSIVCLIFMISLPFAAIQLNNYLHAPVYSNIFLQLVGFKIFIVGGLLFLYCSQLFKIKGNGTPVPIEPPKKLVIERLYRYSRNPMYVGYWLLLFGEFLIFGHMLLFFYAVLFIFLNHAYVIFVEEKELEKRFGVSYKEYKNKVPRYFPSL